MKRELEPAEDLLAALLASLQKRISTPAEPAAPEHDTESDDVKES